MQTWVRSDRLFSTRSPQPLLSCVVSAGGSACTRLPIHAGLDVRIQFQRDHIVVTHEGEGSLVVEVTLLALDLLILPGAVPDRCAPAFAALLAARDAPLRLLEPLLGCAMMARIVYALPARHDQYHLEPDIDASLFMALHSPLVFPYSVGLFTARLQLNH